MTEIVTKLKANGIEYDIGGGAWGSITGTLSDQTDLQTELTKKQTALTPGDGVSIVTKGRFPEGYTKLESITSSGTQFINTGFKQPTGSTIKVEFKFQGDTNNKHIMGAQNSSGRAAVMFDKYITSGTMGASSSSTIFTIPTSAPTVINYEMNDTTKAITATQDGVALANTTYTGSPISTVDCYLFSSNYSSAVPAPITVYYATYYVDGVKTVDLVPAKRNSDNVIGMIDLVSGDFKINIGSGTFTAGSEVQVVQETVISAKTPSTIQWRNKLKGKKISILGDSISTYTGYLTPSTNTPYYPACQSSPHADITSVDQTWWKIVIDKAEMVLGANNSFSGRTLLQSATTDNITALAANGTPDIIMVYLGTNDANQQVTLGTINKEVPFNVDDNESYGETLGTNLTQEQVDALTTTDYYTALRTLIVRLQWYYPNARIVFMSLGWGSYRRFFADNPYRKATQEVCDLLGVDLIDVRKCGIHMPKFTDYTLQRVHPNKAGMALIGEYVYNQLMAMYGYTAPYTGKDVTSLSYTGTLEKTSYVEGESFDSTGLLFTATFNDDTTLEVTPTFTPDPLTPGSTSVTATYAYNTTEVTCSVSGITVRELNPTMTNPDGYKFYVKESLSDMVLKDNCSVAAPSQSEQVRYAGNEGRTSFMIDTGTTPAINGYILSVEGGETIKWQPSSALLTTFPEFAFGLIECTSTGAWTGGTAASGGYAWLTEDYTLGANTKYLMLGFRLTSARTARTLTAEEKALVMSSITIQPAPVVKTLHGVSTTIVKNVSDIPLTAIHKGGMGGQQDTITNKITDPCFRNDDDSTTIGKAISVTNNTNGYAIDLTGKTQIRITDTSKCPYLAAVIFDENDNLPLGLSTNLEKFYRASYWWDTATDGANITLTSECTGKYLFFYLKKVASPTTDLTQAEIEEIMSAIVVE